MLSGRLLIISLQGTNTFCNDCRLLVIRLLSSRIIRDDRRPFHQAYDFIFDRLRCIRQEIVIANLPEQETLELLEPMIIFLAYSYYQLCDEDISKFDPKICGQHLQECLKKALKCYDDMEVKRGRKLDFAKRPLIESIYLIFNLGSEEAMQRGVTVKDNPDLQFESTFLSTWMISKFCWQGNFFRAIKLTKHLPVLLQGLVFAKHMQGWRECLLRDFSAAYNSPNVSVPNEFLCKVLFVGESSLKSLSLHYNMEDVPKDCLRFSKITHRYDAGALKPQKEIKFTFSSI